MNSKPIPQRSDTYRWLFTVPFEDGSIFRLPSEWEDVFLAYFGNDATQYPPLAERIRFVVGKYMAHKAWPSKFDGLAIEDDKTDQRYDDPQYYAEQWDEWDETGIVWGDSRITNPPTWAEVAEAVMYQHMRLGLLQQVMDTLAKERNMKAPRVILPEDFLGELKRRK